MTKAEFKRRKDKLLVHRNTIISRIHAHDKDILDQLKQAYGDVGYKGFITAVKDQHKKKEQELKDEFNSETTERNHIQSGKPQDREAGNGTAQEKVSLLKEDNKERLPANEREIVPSVSRQSKDFLKPRYITPEREAKRTAELRNWQRDAADALFNRIVKGKPMTYLRSGTGTGKTFMVGDVIQQLHDYGWFKDKWPTFYPVLIVTAAPVVQQFQDDLTYRFGLVEGTEFYVTNYEQLRSKYGERHIITTEKVDEDGNISYDYKWQQCLNPHLIVWDEGHKLKNEDSTQHQIAMAVQNLPEEFKTIQVSMSATPWTRIADCKHFATTAGLDTNI